MQCTERDGTSQHMQNTQCNVRCTQRYLRKARIVDSYWLKLAFLA